MAELLIPDEVVIGFFTAVVVGLATAVVTLYRQLIRKK